MKFFDCFMYHDEDLILDIRLNTLNKFIDKFVIVESKFDHQGNEKKLNFNFDNFKKFKNKIIYLIIEKFPNNNDKNYPFKIDLDKKNFDLIEKIISL